MTVPVIAFFNNKGGVGKTSLVYHLSWMFADLGRSVLAADLDPQANLTSAFLDDEELELLWPEEGTHRSIFGAIEPLLRGIGDISPGTETIEIDTRLHLLAGDLALARFEDELSQQWPSCMDGKERAFRVLSALWRILQNGARSTRADVIFVDLGPNLGAINRAALIGADYLAVPLTSDLFSLQGLRNLGPTVRTWRREWQERLKRSPDKDLELPAGTIAPLGYIVMQHAIRLDRPARAYERWINRIPEVYAENLLNGTVGGEVSWASDVNCLGLVKHYRSLMPMAQEAHKPIFHLTPADGAIGAHTRAVQEARKNFSQIAERLAEAYHAPFSEHVD